MAWYYDLDGLACMARSRTYKNISEYERKLRDILDQIEMHESDLNVPILKETKLFWMLKQFQHVNGGKGPGVTSLKRKVVGICKRWRKRLGGHVVMGEEQGD